MKLPPARFARTTALMSVLLVNWIGTGRAGTAQPAIHERTFHQSAKAIQQILDQMQASMSGHLPVLDGFALPSERSFDKYQRPFYQVTVQIKPTGAGAVVHVGARITAWYSDSVSSRSGYQLLDSNGRIETDILDQLSDRLAAEENSSTPAPGMNRTPAPPTSETGASAISAPTPSTPIAFPSTPRDLGNLSAVKPEANDHKTGASEQERLKIELDQLQEVLKNQGHPKNLVAVKKSGSDVVATASLNAKVLFKASAHDEFELLNFNQDWVHVRISGLSRGWLWRNDVEMPDLISDTQTSPRKPIVADLFRDVREETAPFPGDWEPLRGTTVKVISVQKSDESAKDGGPAMKLEFAKSLFDKNYAELVKAPGKLAGIVLIFDSADGGMIAAPQSILEKWKSGSLTDAALWRNCFFDPPEAFLAADPAGSR
ncbi:MAG TPA: hypothetical protein VHW45_18205 [Candidatus Sulfotelmatobacter sp.]|nr:hypothetical protein [Candidatus Sulfotelmatobacter sp.]